MSSLIDALYTSRSDPFQFTRLLLGLKPEERVTLENEVEQILNEEKQDVIFNALGVIYSCELGVRKDLLLARQYFKRGMKHCLESRINLAMMYYYGEGGKQNYDKARILLEDAAEHNNPLALNNLGFIYLEGKAVKQDFCKAKELFERAMKLGSQGAINNLAFMYYTGQGVEQDYNRARELFELTAQRNDPEAISLLGYIYFNGYGGEQNYQKAREFFERGVKLNCSSAMYGLGMMYLLGTGGDQDFSKARELFERAVELGNVSPLYDLALLYHTGRGVPVNKGKAFDLYFQCLKHDIDTSQSLRNITIILKEDDTLLTHVISSYSSYLKLKDQVRELQKQVNLLKDEIDYTPGGKGYRETCKHWKFLLNIRKIPEENSG